MRNLAVLIVTTFALWCAQATAQTVKPSREEIAKLLTLMQAKENIHVALEQQLKVIKESMRQGFLAKMPGAQESVLLRLDRLVEDAMSELKEDELLEATYAVYQKNLTIEEVRAMTEFYSTPMGQRILKKMPVILTESMQAGAAVAQTKMKTVLEKTDAAMLALIEELERSPQQKSK